MKLLGITLIIILVISAVAATSIYIAYNTENSIDKQEFYFGVSFGGNTTAQAKLLIDKVKDYTNYILINNWDISTNETALNEICDYATQSNLHFMVFFDFISNQTYLWHQTWLDTAKQRWGDKFLGIYLYDEPGGQQIEFGQWDNGSYVRGLFSDVKSPSEATEAYMQLGQTQSMNELKSREIAAFTSDFALYWYDYKASYDCVFVEYGWNVSRIHQTALCRGAATSFGKDWGAIITWTYQQPPYIGSGPEILQDMHVAYDAGAKYVVVFNFPASDSGNPYGIFSEEHFAAMQQFWAYTQDPNKYADKNQPQVALVLPKDYGGGLRRADDNVWAPLEVNYPYNVTWRKTWPTDIQTALVWENLNKLSFRYGLKLDVVFDDGTADYTERYKLVYLWNQTLP